MDWEYKNKEISRNKFVISDYGMRLLNTFGEGGTTAVSPALWLVNDLNRTISLVCYVQEAAELLKKLRKL
jgi:hypothetical protein